MTILFVLAALLAANFVYGIADVSRAAGAARVDEFYRVEYKKVCKQTAMY